MKAPSILLLAGTLLVAGSAALLVRVMLKPAPATVVQQQAPKKVEQVNLQAILVASRDLKPGEFIDTAAVRWEETEQEHSPLLYFLKSKDNVGMVLGATVRQPIAKNEALASNLLVHPGQPGFIAAVLKPGMRAISVPTSAVASNSGLISTGDRVDVILSLDRDKEEATLKPGQITPRLASQTLLRDVRVLALNNITRGELTPRSEEAEPKKTKREFYDTATLEVSPAQAERLAVAREIGTLQLVLLSASEPVAQAQVTDPSRITSLSQTTHIYQSFSGQAPKVQMYRGIQTEVLDFGR
ncbi:Flp pilus assembly protein CpaB [Pseudomonas viridiflava]|uniref:Flp pilus assembly protein CpaB n=1 Tax=Pseudomonas viridiflava TaxID=33069 RepID=UPI000F04928F|nr:Flp pilus assembly protein CpaB [Pseudomonas viridiflava]